MSLIWIGHGSLPWVVFYKAFIVFLRRADQKRGGFSGFSNPGDTFKATPAPQTRPEIFNYFTSRAQRLAARGRW